MNCKGDFGNYLLLFVYLYRPDPLYNSTIQHLCNTTANHRLHLVRYWELKTRDGMRVCKDRRYPAPCFARCMLSPNDLGDKTRQIGQGCP